MFEKILIPLDLQQKKLTNRTIKQAVGYAEEYGSELLLMTVIPGFGMPLVASFFPDDAVEQAKKEVMRQLKSYALEKIPAEIKAKVVVAEGNPAERIVAQAKKANADLIIIPSRSRNLEKFVLGSCANQVVDKAACSVLVIKGVG